MTTETNKSIFDKQIETPCIVDFYTTGCPSCEKLSPVFEQLSEVYADISFLKVNLDEDITLAERYGISHVPSLIFFHEGKLVKRNTGSMNKQELSVFIESAKDGEVK